MKKVTAILTIKLLLNVDEDVDVEKVVNELDYDFSDTTTKADIIDSEIVDMKVEDSR